MLWCCWLGGRKGIRPVKKLSGGLLAWLSGPYADLHMALLMPLPLTVSCYSKIYIGFTFLPSVLWCCWLGGRKGIPEKGPLNGCVCVLSRTTRVSQYQKGKTDLDFTEARDSEWQWHQLGYMQVCTSLQTDNHISPPSLSFLQARWPSCCPMNSVKALKAQRTEGTVDI